MRTCCPPGEGCNARPVQGTCALTLLRHDGGPEASRALELWDRYAAEAHAHRSTRFTRRAYARARDRALGLWTPWGGSAGDRAA